MLSVFFPILFLDFSRRAVCAWLERTFLHTDISVRTFIQIFLKQWVGKSDHSIAFFTIAS